MSEGEVPSKSRGNKSTLTILAIVGGVLLVSCLVCGGVLALLLIPAVAKVREAAARTATASHLKQIATAFHMEHDINRFLPAHAIYSKDGNTPLLSWRVALLPYMEQMPLHMQFKLDEPWDSEHNKKLIPLMPAVYGKFNEPGKSDGLTHFQVFTGSGTIFDGPNKMKFSDLTVGDGLSNTFLVVMGAEPVIWTKPDDLVLPPQGEKMPALLGAPNDFTQVVMCDAGVRSISRSLDPALLRALVTPRGKEPIDWSKIEK